MGFSQGVTDDLPDSGRVRVRHLRRALEHAVRLEDGLGWQREHLKEVAINAMRSLWIKALRATRYSSKETCNSVQILSKL
jgi:hypothetical protein